VNDLLLLSRLDAGRLELAPEPLDLPTFLGDLVRQAQPLAEQRSMAHEQQSSKNGIFSISRGNPPC
jgi:signal transduction histidine kinase